jgi:stage II sporulation protein AB (anti-sigma F factor)
MQYDNEMKLEFVAKSENEAFARVAVAAFVSQLDPLLEDISDIKTAVSEAVTNAVIHGYDGLEGKVYLFCGLAGDDVYIEVIDTGHGIADIEKARQPLYTSKPNMERSGMGFTVMEMFMDEVIVESEEGKGTTIKMKKSLERP